MVTQVNSWRRKRVDNGYTEKTQKGGGVGGHLLIWAALSA